MSSINYFGPSFFDSLKAPPDADLSASFATGQSWNQQGGAGGRAKALTKQVGTFSGTQNGTQFDITKSDEASRQKLDHGKIHEAYTFKEVQGKGDVFLTAQDRLDVMSRTETGAIMAVIKILKNDGTTTPPFLTFLGLPTTALVDSNARIIAEEMIPNKGMMEPCKVCLPPECRPIVVTTITNTRDLGPAAIKLQIWSDSNSTLILLKGEEAMKPILFEEEEKNEPAPGSGSERCYLNKPEDFSEKIQQTGTPPKKFALLAESETGEQQGRATGCWYGAPVVFMPPVHNLPLGFAMDPKRAKTGQDIKEALLAFFGITGEDITYDFLLTPYMDSWCKMMANEPEHFAQTVVSLKQVKTSWLMISQPQDTTNVSHAHQATYAHMECMILHRIYRDGMIAGATKPFWTKLQHHEEIIKAIFGKPESDDDEDQRPPLGNLEIAMQPYAYFLVGPAAKAWDAKRGFAELKGALPAPNLARRFQYIANPPPTLEDITEEVRLNLKVLVTEDKPEANNTASPADLTGTMINIQRSVGDKSKEAMFSFLQTYSHQDSQAAAAGSPLTVRTVTEKKKAKNNITKRRAIESDSSSDSKGDSSDDDNDDTPRTPKKKRSKKTTPTDKAADKDRNIGEKILTGQTRSRPSSSVWVLDKVESLLRRAHSNLPSTRTEIA